jgi:hypothetical protein
MNNGDKPFLDEQRQAQELFDIDASDSEITSTLRKRIAASETFYRTNEAYNLEEVRKKNLQMLYGDHYKAGKYPTLRESSIKYQEPDIYAAVQTIVSYATSKPHEVEARPWNEGVTGRILARDFSKFTEAHGVEHDLRGKTERGIYDLISKRVMAFKLVWDPNAKSGRGDIVPKHMDPSKLVFDHTAGIDDNPGFIAEKCTSTVQDLINRYPKKKAEIFEKLNIKQGTMNQLATKQDYFEVWMTGVGKNLEAEEQLVVFFGGVVLQKSRNPHWLYDIETEDLANYLDFPPKPYIIGNLINDGSNMVDQTSLIEIVAPMQHALNRRKRIILEAAEKYGGLNVFNSNSVDKEDVEDLEFSGDESILVDAEDVNKAVAKVSPNFLPQWILADTQDIRNTIYAIIGTPPNLRGDKSDTDTLGEAIMQRDQAEGRLEPLMRTLDAFFDKYFKMFHHFARVYLTEEHWQTIAGKDGTFDYVMMSRDRLKDGLDVYVKNGSNKPQDDQYLANVAVKLASMNRIDNRSLYDLLHLPNADEMAQRLIKETVDPTLVAQDIKTDEGDDSAFMDYEVIKAGKFQAPRIDPELSHITTHREQMLSDEFVNGVDEKGTTVWTPEKKQAFMDHVNKELESIKRKAEAAQMDLQNKVDTDNDANIPGNDAMQAPPDENPAPSIGGQPGVPQPPVAGAPLPPPAPAPALGGVPIAPNQGNVAATPAGGAPTIQ